MTSENYRQRIYDDYSTTFQDLSPTFDASASLKWGRAYKYYFRGWLPKALDAPIVDLACGGGKLLHFLKTAGYNNLHGVDISPQQVRIAQQVLPAVTEENILPFLQRQHDAFDLLTGIDVIEHLSKDDVLRFLDAAMSSLRVGGRIILQTPNADSPLGMQARYGDFTHEVCFNPNALKRLLTLVGFREIEARELGPVPLGYGVSSTTRFMLWQCIRLGLKLWNLAETGSSGSNVYSRNFLVSAVRS